MYIVDPMKEGVPPKDNSNVGDKVSMVKTNVVEGVFVTKKKRGSPSTRVEKVNEVPMHP